MRIVVLGSTGMLGSEVSRVSKAAGVETIDVSRTEGVNFNAASTGFEKLAEELQLGEGDYLVNCIGWIPQKTSGSEHEDKRIATLLNTELPGQINQSVIDRGFHWIQIGTDCVFSGANGRYRESSPKDATDLYGASKIEGEKRSSGAMLILASIIGPDKRTRAGLYSWFQGEALVGRRVAGYANHLWNGVSTTAFARLVVGLAMVKQKDPFVAHWIPSDVASKLEILALFAKNLRVSPELIEAGKAPQALDRTLETDNPEQNRRLWSLAGYSAVPTIGELVAELVSAEAGKEVR